MFANLGGQIDAGSHDWKTNRPFHRAYLNQRVHKWEHVERFSSALIGRLDDLMSLGGVAAHGEMFSSTICLAEGWCSATDLRLDGSVAMDTALYGLSTSVFAAMPRWEREELHERQSAKGAAGVWLHAVKNYCNALALASNGTERVNADADDFILMRLADAVHHARDVYRDAPGRSKLD